MLFKHYVNYKKYLIVTKNKNPLKKELVTAFRIYKFKILNNILIYLLFHSYRIRIQNK